MSYSDIYGLYFHNYKTKDVYIFSYIILSFGYEIYKPSIARHDDQSIDQRKAT